MVFDSIIHSILLIDIKKNAQAVNNSMFELISSKEEKAFKYLDLDSVMKVLQQYLIQGSVDTKVAVLKWIHHLFTQAENEVHYRHQIMKMIELFEIIVNNFLPLQMSTHANSLFPVLFETLSNNSDEVVIQGLTVLAEIVNSTNKSKGK